MIMSMLSNKYFFYLTMSVLLVLLMMTLSLYQSKLSKVKYAFFTEQNKSFECGFDQFNKKYMGFCVQYIKTAFLFLMVDLEIALLLPLFVNTPIYEKNYLLSLTMMFLIFVTFLLMLLMEVIMGSLSWHEEL